MNAKNFDERIKSALDNIEPAYDASTWELLEKRLNAPFAEEHPAAVDKVDKAVFHKLERLEAPYQSAHWEKLATRLDRLSRRRRRILFTKIAEAAIFLLLIANLDGLLPEKTHPIQPVKRSFNGPVASAGDNSAIPADELGIREIGAVNNSGYSLQFETSGYNAPEFFVELLPNQTLTTGDGSLPQAPDDLMMPTYVALASADQLPIGPFAVHYDRVNHAPHAVPVKVFRHSNWYLAVGPSIDRNRVYTDHGVRKGTGYGAAVAVGYRKGKWGFETGMDYARKQYEPKRQIEIYTGNVSNGYYGSALNRVDADVVSVPFKATRRVAILGKGSLHALAGASANIVVQKAYDYDTYYFPGSAPSGSRPLEDDENAIRPPARGALEQGGQWDGNVYAAIDAGLRYEHPIGKRFTAFVEPGYRMALPGQSLGPDKSTVHTLSVKAGLITSL